ncbi:hypothetical protein ACTHGU_10540 [Chitinophagaceae bacterium MMS25-I14]
MKKILLLTVLLSGFKYTEAQSEKYHGYISPGISMGGGLATYSLEGGIWNNKIWLGAVLEATKGNDNKLTFDFGPKLYRKLLTSGDIDVFAYFATKMVLDKGTPLIFEPGGAVVYNINQHFALQWSFSSPIYENTQIFNPVNLSAGIGINYFF